MKPTEDITYGFGDYMGKLANSENYTSHITPSGKTFVQRIISVMEYPKIFMLWSVIELVLYVSWFLNPWPLPKDFITKHTGAIELFVLIYITVDIIYLLFFILKKNNDNIKTNVYTNENGTLGGLSIKLYSTLGSIFLFVLTIVGFYNLVERFDFLYFIVTNLLSLIIFILGITFIYLLVKPSIKNSNIQSNQILTFIYEFVLFIPCLVVALFEWFLKQESGKKLDGSPDRFYARKSLVWIVLFAEIIFIALRFAIPYIFNKLSTHDSNRLLNEPVYLNKPHILASYKDLHKKKDVNYQYSLSAWIYINPQPPSTSAAYNRFTPLLSFGNKPTIEYNGKTNELRVITEASKTKNGNIETVTLSSTKNIQYQKWNNFVINYDGANMDVFVNGELIGTQPNIAPYMGFDDITVGYNNGIHGGICNVNYYNRTLTKGSISLTYKTLKDITPPII